jgi:hypothetical protein
MRRQAVPNCHITAPSFAQLYNVTKIQDVNCFFQMTEGMEPAGWRGDGSVVSESVRPAPDKTFGGSQAGGRSGRRQRAGGGGGPQAKASGAGGREHAPGLPCRPRKAFAPAGGAGRSETARAWRTVDPARPLGRCGRGATAWAGLCRRRHGQEAAAAAGEGSASRRRRGGPATGRPRGGGEAARAGGAPGQSAQRTQKRRRVAPPPFFLEERKL